MLLPSEEFWQDWYESVVGNTEPILEAVNIDPEFLFNADLLNYVNFLSESN